MVKGPNILELLRNVKRSGFLRHTHTVYVGIIGTIRAPYSNVTTDASFSQQQ